MKYDKLAKAIEDHLAKAKKGQITNDEFYGAYATLQDKWPENIDTYAKRKAFARFLMMDNEATQ
ncbi:MAG: hypothetical protein V3U84_00060 [Thiotrichaceae bacterium]